MNDISSQDDEARARLAGGGQAELAELFDRSRARLRGLIKVRLDHHLQGRVDPSDVIQEAYVEAQQRLGEYQRGSGMSPYVWIRFLTMQRLMTLHRRHLAAQQRDARREIPRLAQAGPEASSINLASVILAAEPSPSQALQLNEQRLQLGQALEQMEPTDREVLAMKHFEHMSNQEVAEVLEISLAAASQRYYRALKKLRRVLQELFGDELG